MRLLGNNPAGLHQIPLRAAPSLHGVLVHGLSLRGGAQAATTPCTRPYTLASPLMEL